MEGLRGSGTEQQVGTEINTTETKSPVEILKQARARIAEANRWTKGAFARSFDGVDVHPDSDLACMWCLDGALMQAANGLSTPYYSAFSAIQAAVRYNPISFNDDPKTTHADVLNALDRAIELASKRGEK